MGIALAALAALFFRPENPARSEIYAAATVAEASAVVAAAQGPTAQPTIASHQEPPAGVLPLPGGAVLIAWHGSGNAVVAMVQFGAGGWTDAIAPAGLTVDGTTQVSVSYNNQKFGPAGTKVTVSNPGIFRLQIGQSAQAVAINQDGTINGPMNPAPRGSVVAMWGTGYGPTNPTCAIGGLNLPYATPLSPGTNVLMTSLDGAAPRSVQYAGSAPSLVCGVEQINFQVAMDAAPGAFFLCCRFSLRPETLPPLITLKPPSQSR